MVNLKFYVEDTDKEGKDDNNYLKLTNQVEFKRRGTKLTSKKSEFPNK